MTDSAIKLLSGKFIVFDGPDGCGKTTQLRSLIARLQGAGVAVRRLREPGGTPIGERIRELLLSTENNAMDVRCEMLLYMASRAQLVAEQIGPALAAGECVVSDRFASSTLAYQGGGGGMDLDQITRVADVAVGDRWPDLTVLFDLDIDEAMARLNPLWSAKGRRGVAAASSHVAPASPGVPPQAPNRHQDAQSALFSDAALKDRIEQRDRDYFQRVRANYLWQAKQWPERYRIVDASKAIAQVEKQVLKTLLDFFGGA